MSDEEDFDEFPSITVNSSIHEPSAFSMPSAEELATQRAREDECERALLRLREEHDAADRECADAMVAALAHSDSSGSEGEAALAAAVSALRVRPARCDRAPRAVLQPAVLQPAVLQPAALQPAAPAPRLASAYADALRDAPARTAAAVTDEIAGCVSDMVLEAAHSASAAPWSSEEVVGVGAWLCAAACGGGGGGGGAGGGGRRGILRALHALLEEVASEAQARALLTLLTRAAPPAALELGDALRGGGPRAARLARSLAARALAVLAALPDPEDCSMLRIAAALPAAWRRLPPAERYLALQLLARLLPPLGAPPGEAGAGGEEAEAARKLLDALAQAAPGRRAQTTDDLKVLVAATKLQVLFHVKK